MSTDFPFHGSKSVRKYRDLVCCVPFVVFFLSSIPIGIYAFVSGDLQLLTNGFDARGCPCGTQVAYDANTGVCKSSTGPGSVALGSKVIPVFTVGGGGSVAPHPETFPVCADSCVTNGTEYACLDGFRSPSFTEIVRRYGTKATSECGMAFDSSSTGTYCWPTSPPPDSSVASAQDRADNDKAYAALASTWWLFAVAVVLTLVLSISYLRLMKTHALALFLTATLAIVGGMVLGGLFLYSSAARDESGSDSAREKKTAANFIFIVAGLAVLLLFFSRNSVRRAISIIKVAAECLLDNASLFFVPIVSAAISLVVTIYFATSCAYLTAASIVHRGQTRNVTAFGMSSTVHTDTTAINLRGLQIFTLIWSVETIHFVSTMVVALVAGTWYFSRPSSGSGATVQRMSPSSGAGIVLRYQLGSAAFAGAVTTILSILKAIIKAFTRKRPDATENPCALVLSLCCMCFAACIERCLKYFTKMAVVSAALNGSSFLTGGFRAASLISANLLTTGSLVTSARIITFLGNFSIVAVVTALCTLISTQIPATAGSPLLVLAACLMTSIAVARFVTNVFSTVVDGILMCVLEDMCVSNAKALRAPSFGPTSVHTSIVAATPPDAKGPLAAQDQSAYQKMPPVQ